jgi:hypothetical protein
VTVATQSAYPVTVASLTDQFPSSTPRFPTRSRFDTLLRSCQISTNCCALLTRVRHQFCVLFRLLFALVLRPSQTVSTCYRPFWQRVGALEALELGHQTNSLFFSLGSLFAIDFLCFQYFLNSFCKTGGIYAPATSEPRICLPNHPD